VVVSREGDETNLKKRILKGVILPDDDGHLYLV
jgi:hypothetical protein